MRSKCEVKVVDKVIFLSGRLDETFEIVKSSIPSSSELNINLKDLISINSSGVRQWILLMRQLKQAKILLFECPKIFVDQANMVKDFIPENAKIMSFYVPFYNEKNETEKSILFKLNEHYTAKEVLPLQKVVDDSGDEMEIDVIESKYFKFING